MTKNSGEKGKNWNGKGRSSDSEESHYLCLVLIKKLIHNFVIYATSAVSTCTLQEYAFSTSVPRTGVCWEIGLFRILDNTLHSIAYTSGLLLDKFLFRADKNSQLCISVFHVSQVILEMMVCEDNWYNPCFKRHFYGEIAQVHEFFYCRWVRMRQRDLRG